MTHQLECKVRILLGMIGQLEKSVGSHIKLWKQIIIEVLSILLELNLCKICKIIICLSNQFLSGQEGIYQ
jgi:hypothetical protein